ncbi:MAG: hypothetical protein QG566_289 [Patescibacteria group bacterium]|jgi:uncharacterized membrane protein YuzA (DUF378 family)|nr:hypothetical protein [Patescibacteria group bacterium]
MTEVVLLKKLYTTMLNKIAFILVIVGALNWGLTAFGYNLVDMIFGVGSTIAMVVYVLVAISALVLVADKMKK